MQKQDYETSLQLFCSGNFYIAFFSAHINTVMPMKMKDKLTTDVHFVILRMLKELQRICSKHDINFWLDYGTMLGAVRHSGFIPWDTEADVGMLRPDFEILQQIIIPELPQDIFFQTKETDPAYLPSSVYIEAKLRDKYSSYPLFEQNNPHIKWHNGIQVDIFVYDAVILNGEQVLANAYERMFTGCKSFLTYGEIDEIIDMPFEGERFFIPAGFEKYLERNYGEYMLLPPEEDRKGEPADVNRPCNHKEVLRRPVAINEGDV